MRKFFAIICLIIFWLFYSISLFLLCFRLVILNPDTYKEILRETNAYESIVNIASSQFQQDLTSIDGLALQKEDIDVLIKTAFTPQWLRITMENLIDQFFNLLLDGKDSKEFSLLISLKEPKEKLLLAAELPAADFKDLILSEIPDEINLSKYLNEYPGFAAIINQIRFIIYWLKIIIISSFCLAGLFFLVMLLLLSNKFKSCLFWLGCALLIPGLIGFVMVFAFPALSQFVFRQYIIDRLPIDSVISNFIFALVFSLSKKIVVIYKWPAIINSVIGSGLVVSSYFIKKNENK